ncbi:MAG: fibronectin type III domain-containing protein [Acutalibacteraceae bacterium]
MKKCIKPIAFILSVMFIFSAFYILPYAQEYVISGDFVFTRNGKNLTLKEYRGGGGEVTVPSSVNSMRVTEIGTQAFAEYYETTPDSERITKVILPTTVVTIGKNAFLECTALKEIEMIGVRSLGEAAFWYCKGLKKAAVSSELKEIGKNAFGKCDKLTLYCEPSRIIEDYAKSYGIKLGALYPEKIKLSKSSVSIEKGKSVTLTVKTTPTDVYYKEFYWSSSSDNAAVSSKGKISGKKTGAATITCMSVFGQAEAKCSVTVRTPSVGSVSVAERKFDYITLSWKKAKDAQGYRLEIKKDGKWVKLCDTKELTYKVTGLKADTAYEFRIRAYVIKGSNKYFSQGLSFTEKTRALGQVKNISAVSNSVKGLSFSWSKVSYASGYQIYELKSNGKYEKVGETSDLIFSQKRSSGSVGKYKVRAFVKVGSTRAYGKFSEPFTFSSRPSKVTSLSVSSKTKDSISLKWKSVKNASGYGIYSVKSGKYTLLKKTDATSYKITGLKSSTKYTYAVRAYIKTTLKTSYGEFSGTVSASTSPAVSVRQSAVNDLNKAFGSLGSEKELYVSYSEKVSVTVSSCDGGKKAKSAAYAYAEEFSGEKKESYNFLGGEDISGVTPKQIFMPEGGFSLKASDIKSALKEKDGSGFRLNVLLNGEKVSSKTKPPINSGVWGMIDIAKVKEAIKGDAVLKACTVNYTGTIISTKINSNGSFDTLTVIVPFSVRTVCEYGDESVETVFSGKIVRDYILTRW